MNTSIKVYLERRLFSKKTGKKSEDVEKNKACAGLGIGAATLATVKKSHITGKVTRYHNTKKENVADILENGLKSEFAKDPTNITNTVLGKDTTGRDNYVYTAKRKSLAKSVGVQRSYLDGSLLGRGPRLFDEYDPVVDLEKRKEYYSPKHSKTLKLTFKYDDIKNNKRILNPEVKETYAEQLATGKPLDPISYNRLKETHVFEGDILPEHIVGSRHYKKYTTKDLKNYIKNNPKRFGKEAAKVGIGSAALIYGGLKAYKHYKNKKSKKD